MTVAQWAEEKRYLSDFSAIPGRFSLDVTPYLREILESFTERSVDEMVCQKSAQIGWTDGVICNVLGYTADIAPAPVIVMFPRDKSAQDFSREKFVPMVQATPTLAEKISTKGRDRDNTLDHKSFPGGFCKLVGSNSTGAVKSTPAKILIVEEPDDCNLNLKGQGDSIQLLKERGKTFADKRVLVGGTPTIDGVSSIQEEMLKTDQRRWMVPCHHCGDAHALVWDNVRWSRDPTRAHPVYGDSLPDTARYVCPACGAEWTDAERIRNVRHGRYVATAEFHGARGWYLNELVSPFPDSALSKLVAKYLDAQHAFEHGEPEKLIVFYNATLGLAWKYKTDIPEADALELRAEDYAEWTVPAGGIVLTAGVDVQGDRLAVTIWAWGRGEECWLMWWGEIYGRALDQEVWDELDATVLNRAYSHVSGASLSLSAMSVDSGDGNTADAVYKYVRSRRRRGVFATKGASTEKSEIFRKPTDILDVTAQHKAAKFGLRPYMVGVSRAKDLLLGSEGGGRIQLTGPGPGRMHWYRGVRADFFDQLTAEIKAPVRGQHRAKKVWQKKAGKRNEALDCTILALHSARALRIDTWSETRWQEMERQFLQPVLFTEIVESEPEEPVVQPVASIRREVIRVTRPGVRPNR